MSRIQVTAAVDVDRPPAEVFGYLADVARHGEWSPKPLRIEGVAPGSAAAAGTRFTSYGWVPGDGDHRNDNEVTRSEAPSRLELVSMDGTSRFTSVFIVGPRGAGSRVERVLDMRGPAACSGSSSHSWRASSSGPTSPRAWGCSRRTSRRPRGAEPGADPGTDGPSQGAAAGAAWESPRRPGRSR